MFSLPAPALPEMAVSSKDLTDYMEALREVEPVWGGVASVGEASWYALVWEYGNARQTKQGPKTTLGINPNGSEVWLSIQAPLGYIALNTEKYQAIAEHELSVADLSGDSAKKIQKEINAAVNRISERCAEIIRAAAPVDTGELSESIEAVKADDPDLVAIEEETGLGHEAG